MWLERRAPMVIAHRGDSAHAPENTLVAFSLAQERGADAVEFDVKLTGDGQVIILHDQSVDRTTNGHGDIRNFSLSQVKELDAGGWFDPKFSNERIPSLDDVFSQIGGRILMNIELTNYATPGDLLVERVAELVLKFKVTNSVLFSSFFLGNLRKAKRLLPGIPCGMLASKGIKGFPWRTWGWRRGMDALHPYLTDVSETLVSKVHRKGKRINVWTVNDPGEMDRLLALGIDGIFTDDPGLLLEKIRGRP